MTNYATVNDVTALFRPLSADEQGRAAALIPLVCSRLRNEAAKRGRNLDEMVLASEDLANIAKQVTVDIVARTLMTPTSGAPMTQMSESGLGYSASGTFLNPGGGLFVKESELAALGLRRQTYGAIDLWPQS